MTRDAQLFLLLQHVLATEGLSASHASSMEEALKELADECVRAVIVDRSVTAADAHALYAMKARCNAAVVLLSDCAAEATDASILKDLSDLLLTYPFDPALLIGFLRRLRLDRMIAKSGAGASDQILRFADLEMNMAAVRVNRNGHDIPLTALQFRLLRHLVNNPTIVQSREQLIAAAWPVDADVEPRTVDIHIGHIRRVLKLVGPDLIRTVRTLGYALDLKPNRED